MLNVARLLFLVPLSALLLSCAGGDRADVPYESSQDFPVPDGLEDAVTFWRSVYTQWGRDKVVVHDDRHLALVYEVVDLPGRIEDSYTPAQRDYVEALKARWSGRLRALERKVATGQRLSPTERDLKQRIEDKGGPGAVFAAAERVRTQRGVRERYLAGLEASGAYDALFREVFRRYGLPEDLAYLPHVESSFQLNARSSAGASGMWQFMRSTGQQYMTVNAVIDERLDPVTAADGAARYLKRSYASLHSWPLALTSYNHGLGGMQRARAQFGNDMARIVEHYDGRYFGFASRNFYAQFLAARHVAQNAATYFPEGVHYRAPLGDHPVVLRYAVTVDDLSRHYRVPPTVLIARNYAWLGPIRSGSAAIPAGTKVWVPTSAFRLASGQPMPNAF